MTIHQMQNPNGLAATFDLGADYMNPFGKIVIPRDDEIVKHVPIAGYFFDLIKALNRIDLVHDNGTTQMTLNYAGILMKMMPELSWNDKQKAFVQDSIQDFLKQSGGQVVNAQAVSQASGKQLFEAQNDDVRILVNTFNRVVKPIAQAHGGDFEIIDMDASKSLFSKKTKITTTVAVFGACGGCSSFDKTYGKAPAAVNAELDKIKSPYAIDKIQPAPHRGALILKRG